jgi:lysyl-tRNA synthetase class 2
MDLEKKNTSDRPLVEAGSGEENLSEQRRIRREKLKELREAGLDPYLIEKWEVDSYSRDIVEDFDRMQDKTISLAGRIMQKRLMGKAAFFDIQDKQGRIQCYVRRDDIGKEAYQWFKTYDIGDIVGIVGRVFKTKTGEISIHVEKIVLLTKSLDVLPDKWSGLRDEDLRYRRRYVDLIMNEEVRKTFYKRAEVIKEFRRVLEEDYGFLEVDTPILTTIAGGANARPFITHHNTLNMDMKLRISNELYLKRLIVGGLDRVYEMGKMFRNEGMDRNHNPEFTNMECYMAYGNMEDVMDVTEQLVYKAALRVTGSPVISYQGKEFDLTPPWRVVDMTEAVKECTGVDFGKIDTDEEARKAAIEKGLDEDLVKAETRGKIIAEMFDAFCEDKPGYLDGPVFVVGHPVEVSPLAKRDPKDPRITRRFEAYINGWEVANAFSELNDPIDQYQRFYDQQKQLDLGIDDEAHPMDRDFVSALEVGLPPTGGLGVGVDRVIMLICDCPSIRDAVLFPTMKPLDSEKSKKEAKGSSDITEEVEKLDLNKVKVEPLFEDMVDFDTFSKSDFRVVKVIDCEEVPKSKKLLKFTLNDGSGKERIILSGIKSYYSAEELVGKTLLAITNLPPRKMMGEESQGMLLSAIYEYEGEEALDLIILSGKIPAGAKIY